MDINKRKFMNCLAKGMLLLPVVSKIPFVFADSLQITNEREFEFTHIDQDFVLIDDWLIPKTDFQ